jgi:hypothetical protein
MEVVIFDKRAERTTSKLAGPRRNPIDRFA